MRKSFVLIGAALLAVSFNATSVEGASGGAEKTASATIDVLSVSTAPACKPNGDGTFAEIVTTMASVLPAAQGDALLAEYCGDCIKKKLALSQATRLR
jgi:hypothetical protein